MLIRSVEGIFDLLGPSRLLTLGRSAMLARVGSSKAESVPHERLASFAAQMCERLKLALGAEIIIVDFRDAARSVRPEDGGVKVNVRYASSPYSDDYLLRLSNLEEVAEPSFASSACVPIRDDLGAKLGRLVARTHADDDFDAGKLIAMKKMSDEIATMFGDALRHS